VPALFILLYFGFMGRQFSLYLRYFLPLYPVLAALAAYALVQAFKSLGSLRLPLKLSGRAVIAVLLVAATLPGFAYLSIYSKPVTRVEASAWMQSTWPARTAVTHEIWDDSLPLRLPGYPDKQIEYLGLPLY